MVDTLAHRLPSEPEDPWHVAYLALERAFDQLTEGQKIATSSAAEAVRLGGEMEALRNSNKVLRARLEAIKNYRPQLESVIRKLDMAGGHAGDVAALLRLLEELKP